ncbi:translation machinery-associated protein 16 [Sorochytrium milnesiophthora]
MPNNKVKSSKKIGRLDNIHPYSRKAKQAKRALLRDDRLASSKSKRTTLRTTPTIERFVWFKHAMDPERKSLSFNQLRELADMWLSRHDQEVAELEAENKERRNGKSKTREELLRAQAKTERSDYEVGGMEVPNLTKEEVVSFLRDWEGDPNQLPLIETRRVMPQRVKVDKPLPKKTDAADSSKTELDAEAAPFLNAIADLTGMNVDC